MQAGSPGLVLPLLKPMQQSCIRQEGFCHFWLQPYQGLAQVYNQGASSLMSSLTSCWFPAKGLATLCVYNNTHDVSVANGFALSHASARLKLDVQGAALCACRNDPGKHRQRLTMALPAAHCAAHSLPPRPDPRVHCLELPAQGRPAAAL